MGKRGTKPFPKIHHELNGNPSKNGPRANDPAACGGLLAPDWLDGIALEKWNTLAPRIAETFGGASMDSDALAIYCQAYATYVGLLDAPATVIGGGGGPVTNPEVNLRNNCIGHLRKYGAVLGLSPSDRVGMPSAGGNEIDPAAEFLA